MQHEVLWCGRKKRPLASVSAVVEEGTVVVFGQQESYNENSRNASEHSHEKEECRVRGATGRASGSEDDENGKV